MTKSKREVREVAGLDRGATMVEYALVVGVVALVAVVGAGVLGEGVERLFVDVLGAL